MAVNRQPVSHLNHKDVVALVKAAGNSVQFDILPAGKQQQQKQPQVGDPLDAAEASTRALVQAVHQQTQRAAEEQQKAAARLKELKATERRQRLFDEKCERLDEKIDASLLAWEQKEKDVEQLLQKALAVANYAEMKEYEKYMQKVELKAKDDLDRRQLKPRPAEAELGPELTASLRAKEYELELALLAEEISTVRCSELQKLERKATERKATENASQAEKEQKIMQAREQDLQQLKERQARMERILAEAEAEKAEEARRLREQKRLRGEEHQKKMEERAMLRARLAQEKRDEAQRREEEEARKRQTQEQEASWQRKEQQRLAELSARRKEEEAEERRRQGAAVLFGGGMLKRSAPPPTSASKDVHPMIAAMAAQREKEEADTRM
eukprot:m.509051 g.509051  ORF g.509051 m.509051 type:complete len:385 (+) comp91391_c0_seq1:486-1640(+)